jgi:DNA-binding transcriptional LysR family regulator
MFDLIQLRCFVAVAEALHFGRAAQRLNMTQPPLSRQVQILERILQVKLFERTSRSVRLTPAGRSFLPEARRLLRLAEAAALSAKRTARGEAGSIALGFTAASGYGFLTELIPDFRARLPDIDLELKELVTADQVEALIGGRIDVGLLRPPVDRRIFKSFRVVREPLLLAVPSDHPLAIAETPVLADLDRQPLVMYSPYESRYFYDLLAAIFAEADISPKYVQHISQIHSILALVRAGLGAALVPKAAGNLHFEGVVLRSIGVGPTHHVELHAAWRPQNSNPAMPLLLDLITHRAMNADQHIESGAS